MAYDDEDLWLTPMSRFRRDAQTCLEGMAKRKATLGKGKDCFMVLELVHPHRRRKQNRFVQFCFMDDGFVIDLPNTTLSSLEANRVVAHRQGFYRSTTGRGATSKNPAVNEYEPLNKRYRYGEERIASLDAEWIFRKLWRRSDPCQILAKIDAFDGPVDWRMWFPLDAAATAVAGWKLRGKKLPRGKSVDLPERDVAQLPRKLRHHRI